jgi:DNA repair exonuclease SbcCD ATPase subunit
VKQILEDSELVEMMKEVLIHEGKPCPFCHRKLKGEAREKEIW